MTDPWYRPILTPIANAYTLDPRLVEAVVWTESRGQADAFRFEPKFWERYLAKLPEYKGTVPRRVSSSYGLMQIMYVTAKELGFSDEPERLFLVKENLHWGCRKLQQLTTWAAGFPTVPYDLRLQAICASYNGGRGGNTPGTELRNQKYADRVLATYRELL